MATKRPKRIETFQILDLMQEIQNLKKDEDGFDLEEDEYEEIVEELNAKLLKLLDTLVALQDKP